MKGDTLLNRLSALYGIATEYTDVWGKRREISNEVKETLLADLGVSIKSDGDLQQIVDEYERRAWRRLLPPVQVVRESQSPFGIVISVASSRADERLRWSLMKELGQSFQGDVRPRDLKILQRVEFSGDVFTRYALPLPHTLGIGYHQMEVEIGDQDHTPAASMQLIVVPDTCYQPAALTDDRRVWGPVLQLYAVRSQRNWGIGDFTDLKTVIEVSADLGADMVGVNPLHALFPHHPNHASPYSPSSRLFLNILYLDVEAIPDFAECSAARRLFRGSQFQARLRASRASELVDYEEISRLKREILELLYRHFREHHLAAHRTRGRAFRAFQGEAGRPLLEHALFEALQEHFYRDDPSVWGWPAWPKSYRDSRSDAVAAFATTNQARVEFFEYLQWQAGLQLEAAGRRSVERGLAVGIYQDLALSSDPGGAETWANQGLYALNVHVGAPPDEFNLKGQDWGLPPMIPERLREAAYQPFIAALRATMRHAGALRLDHVMGLRRLYWVPPDAAPTEGTYVFYPFEDLLGVLSLESHRNRCLVIGEDLGTVPDDVRASLKRHGVLSYRVLYFERAQDGAFKPPAEYPREALVTVSTHDLPTLAGYWGGTDLTLRSQLGLFPTEAIREQQIVTRAEDRARLLVALEREGLLPAGIGVDPISFAELSVDLARAIHRYVARTPAKLMGVQLEDLFAQREQANLPGTIDEYPNWRRKLALNVEDWSHDPRLQALAKNLGQERDGNAIEKPVTAGAEPARLGTRIPIATYRLQFNRDFTFAQAAALIPYLHALGISHCYASPYLKARPGSTHGYDIIDHNAINPEIGSLEEFERFVDALRSHGMAQILDMVPNHMGVMGSDNAWWLDVLENGSAAQYAAFFDIDWEPVDAELRGKVLLPILADHYGAVLEQGELQLVFNAESGAFSVRYHEHRFPIDPKTYPSILGHRTERLQARLRTGDPQMLEYESVITAFNHLPARTETQPEQKAERTRDKEIYKQHLAALCERCSDIAWFIEENLLEFNGRGGEARSFDLLHALLEAQAYRLSHWRVASDEINYRRFFDVHELAGLRMEDEAVFDATHAFVLQLIESSRVDGLRIDHPDGLYDPVQYFKRLQDRFNSITAPTDDRCSGAQDRSLYLVAEKILASHERLPEDWPVQGTTGYDFANLVNGLFVDGSAEAKMDHIYAAFIGERINFDQLLYRCKRLIMKVALASELNMLANRLYRIAQADRRTRDFTRNSLRAALSEVVACFPVYRTYITGERVSSEDRRHVDWAVSVAKQRSHTEETSILDFVRDVLLIQAAEGKPDPYREALVNFVMRFQQYTSPVMAKSLEDTGLYIYNRLLSLNDVGGDPRRFGVSLPAFHHANQERAKRWPHGMLCTSTHDSKRSEDVRARINVLSELPEEWQAQVQRWRRINRGKRRLVDDTPAPARNDEYLLYQTLIGTWPLAELDDAARKNYCERIEQFMLKAVREAKVYSSWINPRVGYEGALRAFIRALLENSAHNRFLAQFKPFQKRIARLGMFNSLSQTLLKLMSPGVPDLYQGNELWDLSLVDPDNRRAVDYTHRQAILRTLQDFDLAPREHRVRPVRGLLESMDDGRIKLYVAWKSLMIRKAFPALFRNGDYQALNAKGPKADHVCAFARNHGSLQAIVIVPRLIARLLGNSTGEPLGLSVWGDTYVEMPAGGSRRYRDVFTDDVLCTETGAARSHLPLANALAHFPAAFLMRHVE